jgi:choline dehydrogenase-like flavoprotein
MPGFGADFKEALRQPGPWQMSFGGFGECLPRHSNYVEIDPDKKDRWGVPVLRIHCEWSDNELAMLQDMSVTAAEMLEAAGCTDITPYRQCHDVPNLFVTDGASMASTACQNPSLTYMALTARACAYAVEQLQRREL